MDENKMGWRECARYAEMSVEELARDCEVQVFRATGPGGQGVNTTDSAVRMKQIGGAHTHIDPSQLHIRRRTPDRSPGETCIPNRARKVIPPVTSLRKAQSPFR